ncbi:MAG: AhpC/TSA family protein [Vicinamibacteria bacterium]
MGNGNRHFAYAFRKDFAITTPVYVDTQRDVYRALGMRRGLASALASAVAWKSVYRALKAGFRQGATQGDPWQLGGVLVVLPGGRVSYLHSSVDAGDHAPLADILAALPRPGAHG